MPSPARIVLFAALLVLPGLSAPPRASAGSPPPQAATAPPPAPGALVLQPGAAVPSTQRPDSVSARVAAAALSAKLARTPLMTALAAVMDDEGRQLEPLLAELSRSTIASSSLELQRRIEQVKQGTELQMLRVQAAFARTAGNTVLADRIDAAIAEQLQPRLRLEPQQRPAPAGEAR